jgi:hypothetical protein
MQEALSIATAGEYLSSLDAESPIHSSRRTVYEFSSCRKFYP